jgi:heme exporter protein B
MTSLGQAALLLIRRDVRLAWRRRTEALLGVAFLGVAVSLFPLGVGPEPEVLRQMAPGVIWVCALLAVMLCAPALYAGDHADGALEQMMLTPQPLVMLVAAKTVAHWLVCSVPMLFLAPLLGLMLGLNGHALMTLWLTLWLGLPVLSLLGGLGSALTLGLRSAGMLLVLVVLPLAVPVLIFGAGAVVAVQSGLSAQGHLSLLGALLLGSGLLLPWATAAALRIAQE